MFDATANLGGKGVKGDLSDHDEEYAKGNVAERPAVFEGVEDEGDLKDYVDCEEDCVEDVQDDKKGCG